MLHLVFNPFADSILPLDLDNIGTARQLNEIIDLDSLSGLASTPEIGCRGFDVLAGESDEWRQRRDVVQHEIFKLQPHDRIPSRKAVQRTELVEALIYRLLLRQHVPKVKARVIVGQSVAHLTHRFSRGQIPACCARDESRFLKFGQVFRKMSVGIAAKRRRPGVRCACGTARAFDPNRAASIRHSRHRTRGESFVSPWARMKISFCFPMPRRHEASYRRTGERGVRNTSCWAVRPPGRRRRWSRAAGRAVVWPCRCGCG